ncbi:DUF2971 domain-containing protein [Pseudoalteromonas tunicata]|jgi:hypothetical protein|uniref:DUF2971 domain-containing protein n=1 Tax=Pseudoalteromonas tunicata D2 TaxID=87626 RepID=A4C8S4_9GAMM|nr:DUF2971 domain-containing protein [Pseudoalteromonas tunicata]ATC93492.1 hypothetical protein PTUN_a0752 [Pseudoalteromonas tunicata]AXT32531.1 DUF2971 domain-containing protein [Pseudoalteromonas tunicata]EAR28989.1 hypothetical protein PTD2_08094 [Pseudoalteromonas tunicata D2]
MRVYHFIDKEFGLKNIRNRRLKVSDIMTVNDPFEFFSVITADIIDRSALTKTKEQLASKFGFLCFSESWKSPVQWAHYAERHTGLCLGFDIPDGLLHKIDYVGERFHLPQIPKEDDMKRLLETKYSHWSYEQEHRLWDELKNKEGAHYFRYFDKDLLLKQVIVGHKSDITRDELNTALGSLTSECETFKARPAYNTFDMVKQKDDRFWK